MNQKNEQAQGAELSARPSRFETEMLGVNLAENLSIETWMDHFTTWQEQDFVKATMSVDCHPEGWDFACFCRECQSCV